MKHLKRFSAIHSLLEHNESLELKFLPGVKALTPEEISLKKEELRDFCETYLAYLLDEGFELRIYGGSQLTSNDNVIKQNPFQISLVKQDQSIFSWHDIIDQFLPFLKFLKDNYNLERVDPSSTVPYHRKADIKFVDYRWHGIMYQTKGLLEERHNALDTKKLREVYFMVTIK
jgi:hypothetical protein